MSDLVYDHGGWYVVKTHYGTYRMHHHSGAKMAELMNGQKGLEKQYHGNFEIWHSKVRKKKIATIESYSDQIDLLVQQIDTLKKLWRL